jgi:hypothetical protein
LRRLITQDSELVIREYEIIQIKLAAERARFDKLWAAVKRLKIAPCAAAEGVWLVDAETLARVMEIVNEATEKA